MGIFSTEMLRGDLIQMRRTDPRHFNENGMNGLAVQPAEGKDFGSLLMSKLDEVNQAQTEVNRLNELMLTNPDQVNADEITIAMAKAEMAIGITKAVVDKAVAAYKDIINMR